MSKELYEPINVRVTGLFGGSRAIVNIDPNDRTLSVEFRDGRGHSYEGPVFDLDALLGVAIGGDGNWNAADPGSHDYQDPDVYEDEDENDEDRETPRLEIDL